MIQVWFVYPPGMNAPNSPGLVDNVGNPISIPKDSRVVLGGREYVVDSVRWDFDRLQVYIQLR